MDVAIQAKVGIQSVLTKKSQVKKYFTIKSPKVHLHAFFCKITTSESRLNYSVF